MEPNEREVAVHPAHAPVRAVLIHHLPHGLVEALAEGTLQVGELYDGNLRLRGALHVVGI